MKACVFVGPTLAAVEAHAELDALLLPPVRLGDVYQAVTLLRPHAIGIVDGHFQWAPAVWHKEILWALQQGVQVFGAASMGALRAAELEAFGMRGIGRVFEAYRDGCLAEDGAEPFEDDDEVAVVHGPAELGHPQLSEAMVNIRLTLAKAAREGVVAEATRVSLQGMAKRAFFPERSYRSLLDEARRQGLPAAELQAFERWLPNGAVDQKRADALAMLRAMRAWTSAGRPSAPPSFHFETTCFWQQALAQLDDKPALDGDDALALAELRLDNSAWRSSLERVLQRLAGPAVSNTPLEPATAATAALSAARSARARAALLEQLPGALIERQMLEQIKTDGRFERLRARSDAKRRCLAGLPASRDVESLSAHQRLELTDWFFTTLLDSELPDDLDQWIRRAGYADEASFHAALFDEFRFRQISARASPPTHTGSEP